MATYLYRKPGGETIEIDEPMGAPHPDVRIIDGVECRRVFTVPGGWVDQGPAVSKTTAGLPVSRSLPLKYDKNAKAENFCGHRVFRHSDGTLTDRRGRQIVATKRDEDRLQSQGYKREK